jgi:hypothetical protein
MKGGDMPGALGMLAARGDADAILWILAAVLVIAGIVALIRDRSSPGSSSSSSDSSWDRVG